MNIILLQGQLTSQEIDQLIKEFPHYLFLSLSEAAYTHLSPEDWGRLEILYGARLTQEDLSKATALRWIHCPAPHLNRLCLDAIEKQGNILVTNTVEENIPQMGEFVLGVILAFAKNLFAWRDVNKYPSLVWDSKWRDSMWTLKDKVLLQIGLGSRGTEIAKQARHMGMRVWGMQPKRSFHPYCHKNFALEDLHSLLPQADVVSVSLPRGKEYEHLLKEEELDLMKEDSILCLLGSSSLVKEDALTKNAEREKFRGILLDAWYQTPIPATSPLWKTPNLIITPEVAPRPKAKSRLGYHHFLYNLRQYTHSNFNDMRHLVNLS